MSKQNILYVYWRMPKTLPNSDAIILSFLSPGKEEELKNKFSGRLISARQIAPEIKEKARRLYIELIARLAATPVNKGKTLREALKKKDNTSLWWFHKVSHKDCESDATFQFIIEALIINSVAETIPNVSVVLYGGYKEMASLLKEKFKIKEIRCIRKYNLSLLFFKGMASRIKYFFTFLFNWFLIKRHIKNPINLFDIVFSGFWDWSVNENKNTNKLHDCYFKSLPDRLQTKGINIGWFLWFDPYGKPGAIRRKIKDILEPIKRYDNLIILQSLIRLTDLIKNIIDLRPFFTFLNYSKISEFRKIFIEDNLNFYHLLKAPLYSGFLDSSIAHLNLVYEASQRAFHRYGPKVSVSFLELFLHSRAFYAGGKKANPKIIHCAIQHCSYGREKTFVVLEPKIEFGGFPDGFPVPRPDYVFTMGELGRERFLESGFPEGKVLLTGSSRYEDISDRPTARDIKSSKIKNLLMVPTLNRDLEMEMVEAVYLATKDLSDIQLFLRNHPFAKMDEHPDFANYSDRIQISKQALEQDLEMADLILFSYSTVAEEALIRGIPVWQWVSASYNGSIFCDFKAVPAFTSITDLRKSLQEFISNSENFVPDKDTKELVQKKCFYSIGKENCERIADYMACHFLNKVQ